MIALASASLGLVAALAWNEAIKATIARITSANSLVGLYLYVLATVIAILVLIWLGVVASCLGGESRINRESEG